MIVLYLCAQLAVLYTYSCLDRIRGMIVLYLCAQLAVLYTYNCLLIMICYSLGQNQLIIINMQYALGIFQGLYN